MCVIPIITSPINKNFHEKKSIYVFDKCKEKNCQRKNQMRKTHMRTFLKVDFFTIHFPFSHCNKIPF